MRPTSKDSHWKTAFKNAGLCTENCGESRPIFVNVNMYEFKYCAAISGEFLKSSEMAAHNSNAYTYEFSFHVFEQESTKKGKKTF